MTLAQGVRSKYDHKECRTVLDHYIRLPECTFNWKDDKEYGAIYEDSILKNVYRNKNALIQEIDKYLNQYYNLRGERNGNK